MADNSEWRTYEEVARYLLNQFADLFGLDRFEGKQKVAGLRSGTEWEIDAKGVAEGSDVFLIVECRRYSTSRQNQEKIGSLAYRIRDTGAGGAIIVSPLGLQEGARRVAGAEGIKEVMLRSDSTTTDYFLRFLNEVRVGISDIGLSDEAISVVHKNVHISDKGEGRDTVTTEKA